MNAWLRSVVSLLLLAGAVCLVLQPLAAPDPVEPSSPAEFSPRRAWAHLGVLAAAPRPPGSPHHDAARAYLEGELRGAGFTVETQVVTHVVPRYTAFARGYPVRAARVENVVGVLPGAASKDPALLLVAHYDSKTTTAGAGDNGYGSAALLELARALAAGGKLSRTVVVLFSDAEEAGLIGAEAYAAQPQRVPIGAVLNFDARGNAGPALMFETGGANRTLVDALATAPHPIANSLAAAIYRALPNDTDFTVWRRAGVPGLNFANIGGFSRYHAPADTLASASPATLAHHGVTGLAVARHLAGAPGDAPIAPDRGSAVFFDVSGLVLLMYPLAWNFLPTLLAFAAIVALGVVLTRREKLAMRRAVMALGVNLVGVVAAIALAVVLMVVLRETRPDVLLPSVRPVVAMLYGLGFVGLGLVAGGLAARAFASRVGRPERQLAGAMLLLFVTLLLHQFLAEGAYLTAWPALGLALGGLAGERWPRLAAGLALLGGLPAFLLLPAHGYLLGLAFGAASGPALALVAALFVLAQPVLVGAPLRSYAPTLVAAGGTLAALVAASASPVYDAAHPRPGTVFLAVDADRGEAEWLSPDGKPPTWAAGRFLTERRTRGDLFPLEPERVFHAGVAVVTGEDGPRAELLEKREIPDGRRLRLRLVSPADTVLLAVFAETQVLRAAWVNGVAVTPLRDGGLYLHLFGPADDGTELVLEASGTAPVPLRLVAQRMGAPALAERPPGQAAKPSMVLPPHQELMDSDATLVTRAFSF